MCARVCKQNKGGSCLCVSCVGRALCPCVGRSLSPVWVAPLVLLWVAPSSGALCVGALCVGRSLVGPSPPVSDSRHVIRMRDGKKHLRSFPRLAPTAHTFTS